MSNLDSRNFRLDETSGKLYTTDKENIDKLVFSLDSNGKLYVRKENENE